MTVQSGIDTMPAAKGEGASRRRFLRSAAATAAAAGATIAMPNVSRAQTVTLKMQGAWGATDIFNEMAMEYVDRVNKMAGGRLKIEYLVAGAVVKPFSLMDAVHEGVLDAGHWVTAYWYGKHPAASLFGTGPVFGFTAHEGLAWIYKGGGLELYQELLQNLGLNIVGFFCMPMPTQPLGWFSKPITSLKDMQGIKYRTVGLAAEVMQRLGMSVVQLPGGEIVPALERGVIDAFEYNNPTSDKLFGAQDVRKVYMMGSYHQANEYFEIIFNKTKFDSLPEEHKAILRYAAEAANTSNYALAMDRYSKDFIVLQEQHGVKVYRTPQDVFEAQLKAWDEVLANLTQDAFFKKVVDSQMAWAKRVMGYLFYNQADYRLAYEHYFGKLPF
ncbi:Monocarboxylate 2-oxoacid-binding periplasmic protein [bacterium HR40]|nr:Monocarboxylate 2-oxoacid-binding periplasmic protein [bacterium HR40]